VLTGFEAKRPSLAALLAHAEVVSLGGGELTLAFATQIEADRAEKARAEIEPVVTSALGQSTRAAFTVRAAGAPAGGTAVRSEVGAESDALAADRRTREAEARQHPMIRRAQDVFGTGLKEIKT
jgi:hypothetical protein